MVSGQETDAWGLKKGMNVSATRITETPLTSVSQHTQVTGTMPPDAPVLIAKGGPTLRRVAQKPLLPKEPAVQLPVNCRRQPPVCLSLAFLGSY